MMEPVAYGDMSAASPEGVFGAGASAGVLTRGRATLARRPLAVTARGRGAQAQLAALRAIEMQGGQAHRLLVEGVPRWSTVDADGRATEALPTRTLEILAERGRLRLTRFGFGGEIWEIAA